MARSWSRWARLASAGVVSLVLVAACSGNSFLALMVMVILTMTVPNHLGVVALSDLASGNYVRYRRVLAGALVATLPLLVMLVVGGRQIVRGIMEGAVKS
ncbi:hypothetical protein [Micromonospora sagamiensis]|uniref:Uncharacterized protein n=1 Tax=Micromonospora sagamiensis TaxID=47875 RepID=A0A562WKX5_9ACTN|nr:hypothetical protein [Micromonospora sagamiensis]TWJ30838.1 hypothetical protein JD81_04387 [Micromonospora sagamiensis]BCL16125.1 hypothetical protein GCM10017556_38640 [Micromonospora sagamiensis]